MTMSTIGLGFSISKDDHIPTNLFGSQKSSPNWTICRVSMNSAKSTKLFMRDAEFNKLSNRLRAVVEGDDETSKPGDFVLHEATTVNEYWGAAWLRTECFHEDLPKYKKTQERKWKFYDKAFSSLEQRRKEGQGRCRCFLMVRREDLYRRHIPMNRIYGTMELSIRYYSHARDLSQKRLFPAPSSQVDTRVSNSYMYITNLCVEESARQQGLATTMLQHAIKMAKEDGIRKVYLRVQHENEAALNLYEKNGFKIAYATSYFEVTGQPLLMFCDTSASG